MHTNRLHGIFITLWKLVLVSVLTVEREVHGAECEIDNIKTGYSIKHGLHQDNVISFGQASDLDSCNRLCCMNKTVNVGLYDGIKCFGITCVGSRDKRCNLLWDGNADFTIFKIVRQVKKEEVKKPHRKKKHLKSKAKKRKSLHTPKTNYQAQSKVNKKHTGSNHKERHKTKLTNSKTFKQNNNKTKYKHERKEKTIDLKLSNVSKIPQAKIHSKDNMKTKSVLYNNSHKHHHMLNSTHHRNREKAINRTDRVAHQNVSSNNTLKTIFNQAGVNFNFTVKSDKEFNSSSINNTNPSLTKMKRKSKHQFHRKHKKRRKKTNTAKGNKKSRFYRDFPFSYDLSHLNSGFKDLKYNNYRGYTYSDLLKASEADQALMRKLLSERSNIDQSHMNYNSVPVQTSFLNKGLPLQPVLRFDGSDLGTSTNTVANHRTDIYGNPLTMPLFYPQEPTRLDTYIAMQQNLLANVPSSTHSSLSKIGKEMIDPGLFLSDQVNQAKQNIPMSPVLPQLIKKSTINSKPVNIPFSGNISKLPLSSTYTGNSNNKQKGIKLPLATSTGIKTTTANKKSQIIKADIQSLKDFPTDKDIYQIDEKDKIPHPEDFSSIEDNVIATKDSSVDVPFSSNVQLQKPTTFPQGLLYYPQSLSKQYVEDYKQHKQQQQHNSFTSSNAADSIYSYMYPLSTIQHKTLQHLVLQSKNPLLQEPDDSTIEIVDVSSNVTDINKREQLQFLNAPNGGNFSKNQTITQISVKNTSIPNIQNNLENLTNVAQHKNETAESPMTLEREDNKTISAMNIYNTTSHFIKQPSLDDVKDTIHEIDELKTQVEGLLIQINTTDSTNETTNITPLSRNLPSYSNFTSPVNGTFSNNGVEINNNFFNNTTLRSQQNVSFNYLQPPLHVLRNNTLEGRNITQILPIVNVTKHTRRNNTSLAYQNTLSMLQRIDNKYNITKNAKITQRRTIGCYNPVGISKSNVVKDDHMTASSSEPGYLPSRGRLRIKANGDDYTGSWCASKKSVLSGKPSFMQVDIEDRKMFCRVAIQGDEKLKKWVKNYKLYFSDNARYWEPYRENGKVKVFYGNEDEKDITYRTLRNPVIARYIRFEPVSWSGDSPCMRVEIFNTSLTPSSLSESRGRSSIPKVHVSLIDSLDFEKMDDAIAFDRSSFGNNGFLAGGAKVYDSHSSCRHALKLPPGADMVIDGSIMKVRPRDAITIASWVRLDKVEGVHSLFDTVGEHSKHDLGQFHFEIVGGDVRWFHRNETEDIIFNVITEKKLIRPNEWNHIAATYDSASGDAIIYVNGTKRVRGKGQGLISKDWDQRVGIGRHKGVRFLDGTIDEFKIYDIALDKSTIGDLAEKCDFTKYFCGSTLTQTSGTIVSPTYPDTIRGPVQCVWNIEGKIGEVIVLDMKQFKLGYKGDCGRATLEVRDKANDALIGSYCGSATPRIVTSHSHQMYLKYYTDGAFKGERFKVEYKRETKKAAKKTLSNHCKASETMRNVTLVGGAKSGTFTDLGYTTDMEDCKDRCCNDETCELAFMIDDNCYSVKCFHSDLCKVRKAKPSNLNPQIAFMSRGFHDAPKVPEVLTALDEKDSLENSDYSLPTCSHGGILYNSTLVGGIKAGNFTSRGLVDSFDECLRHCCTVDNCDAAFMVKRTCFSLQCASDKLCSTRKAKPSPYHPMIAFLDRYKPKVKDDKTGDTKAVISPSKTETCKNNRVSKIIHDVTLKGGISSGEFTDKGHVDNMDECISKCCSSDTCNVAFVIKDTCFTVKCKSYDDCSLKSAISEYYNPKIAYVNWNPPKDNLGESVPYSYKGCWRDFDVTAFALPLLEGTDPKLVDAYKKRSDPVNDCSSVSQSKGYKVFAIQNGGACFSGPDAEQTYKRYGKSEACKGGKGGPFANSVYKSFEDGAVIALGCWADLQDRAFRRMEKNDDLLMNTFESRPDPIGTCAKVAEKLKMKYFALQKSGQCFVAKETDAKYDKYSPSRKCKYGLGGQMANDVYMLKQNFTAENGESRNNVTKTEALNPFANDEIQPDETVYKEETNEDAYVRYVYKAGEPIINVTLASAINAGIFEDKGKMDTISDCVRVCGENKDCNVAFMLSSQCFNVHCFSDDTCNTKPAYSSYYKPELAFIKHRVVTKSKNTNHSNSNTTLKSECQPISELENMTFINGINAGNFSDMGHVDSMDECKSRCCQDQNCHVAFKIQSDCYGVRCYNKDSCKTRPAKNAVLFQPQLALIRTVKDSVDVALEQKTDSKVTSSLMIPTTGMNSAPSLSGHKTPVIVTGTSRSPMATENKCSPDAWDKTIIYNETLVGGINAGDFRDHGQAESMKECMGYCCDEKDCDLSFMIDKDCYTVKCYKPSLCKTRIAKPTTFVPQIAFKKTAKYVIDQSNLTELLQLRGRPTPENETSELAYAAFKSVLLALPDSYNSSMVKSNTNTTKLFLEKFPELFKNFINGTTPSASSVSVPPSVSGAQATPSLGDPKKHSCQAEPIIYNATLRLGMHSGLFTKLGHVKTMDDCIERCCRSSNADVAYMLGPFCFAVKCKTREMCKPSPAMYSDINSLNLNPAISFLNKDSMPSITEGFNRDMTSVGSISKEGTCPDSPITYNVTLRGGVHSGKFTELGEDIPMRDCVGKCCDTPLCDVAFMFSNKCYAVGCYDEAQCQAVIAKPSTLNPKLAYVSKYRSNNAITLDDMPSGIGLAAKSEKLQCDAKNVRHGPVYTNKTLFGGMKAGKFSYLGHAKDINGCLRKCCAADKCDMAYLVNKQQCFSVKCYTPELCQIANRPFASKNIEISRLVKPRIHKKFSRKTTIAYLSLGLLTITLGLTGLAWLAIFLVKRKNFKCQPNDDEPKPDR